MTAEEKEEEKEEEQRRQRKALGFGSHFGFNFLLSGQICAIFKNGK